MSYTTSDHWHVFGQTIRDGRVALKLPKRKFARLCGISHVYLINVELAKVPPPSDAVLLKMAEHLDIPAQTLFSRAGRLPPTVLLAFWSHPAVPPSYPPFQG